MSSGGQAAQYNRRRPDHGGAAVTASEAKLIAVIAAIVVTGTFVFRQDLRKNVLVFLLGAGAGYLFQIPLGPAMNRYTPNITLYVGYVSIAVMLAWGMGLVGVWAVHCWLARLFGWRHGLPLYLFSGVPVVLIVETIGSNVIAMKLNNYQQYASLAPALNAMHAPVWLYAYYVAAAILFYLALRWAGMHTENWRGAPARRWLRSAILAASGLELRQR